jgi:hypothetical protein
MSPEVMATIKRHALLLALLGFFLITAAGEMIAGHAAWNQERADHGLPPIAFPAYLHGGHVWEALFENWESEFLEMAIFVVLTAFLCEEGSAESRRPGAIELSDADPRDFAHLPDVPWPVRRGGWVLWLYERSLGLAFALLFAIAWLAHAITGWRAERASEALQGLPLSTWRDWILSSRFWFQSLQNWQSEFLGIASMVWLSVYLRQRGSPESKPVHASHRETGR